MNSFTVRVPATTANIGPGFDCLGMALTLCNEAEFSFGGDELRVEIEGFNRLTSADPRDNLIYTTFADTLLDHGIEVPTGMRIHCRNNVPMGSGLGSSSTAVVIGLAAANEYGQLGMDSEALLKAATAIEHHPDNAAPAIYGGFVSAAMEEDGEIIVCRHPVAEWNMAVVVPVFNLLTADARKALPKSVPLADAIFNISHTLMVIEALKNGDLELLRRGMQDRLHQSYRFALIPGIEDAAKAAHEAGAASGISGAGPGVIAFTTGDAKPYLDIMEAEVRKHHAEVNSFIVKISQTGLEVR